MTGPEIADVLRVLGHLQAAELLALALTTAGGDAATGTGGSGSSSAPSALQQQSSLPPQYANDVLNILNVHNEAFPGRTFAVALEVAVVGEVRAFAAKYQLERCNCLMIDEQSKNPSQLPLGSHFTLWPTARNAVPLTWERLGEYPDMWSELYGQFAPEKLPASLQQYTRRFKGESGRVFVISSDTLAANCDMAEEISSAFTATHSETRIPSAAERAAASLAGKLDDLDRGVVEQLTDELRRQHAAGKAPKALVAHGEGCRYVAELWDILENECDARRLLHGWGGDALLIAIPRGMRSPPKGVPVVLCQGGNDHLPDFYGMCTGNCCDACQAVKKVSKSRVALCGACSQKPAERVCSCMDKIFRIVEDVEAGHEPDPAKIFSRLKPFLPRLVQDVETGECYSDRKKRLEDIITRAITAVKTVNPRGVLLSKPQEGELRSHRRGVVHELAQAAIIAKAEALKNLKRATVEFGQQRQSREELERKIRAAAPLRPIPPEQQAAEAAAAAAAAKIISAHSALAAAAGSAADSGDDAAGGGLHDAGGWEHDDDERAAGVPLEVESAAMLYFSVPGDIDSAEKYGDGHIMYKEEVFGGRRAGVGGNVDDDGGGRGGMMTSATLAKKNGVVSRLLRCILSARPGPGATARSLIDYPGGRTASTRFQEDWWYLGLEPGRRIAEQDLGMQPRQFVFMNWDLSKRHIVGGTNGIRVLRRRKGPPPQPGEVDTRVSNPEFHNVQQIFLRSSRSGKKGAGRAWAQNYKLIRVTRIQNGNAEGDNDNFCGRMQLKQHEKAGLIIRCNVRLLLREKKNASTRINPHTLHAPPPSGRSSAWHAALLLLNTQSRSKLVSSCCCFRRLYSPLAGAHAVAVSRDRGPARSGRRCCRRHC